MITGSNINRVKTHNRNAVLQVLLQQSALSRVQLADLTGLSTTTITNQVAELLDRGYLREDGTMTPPGKRQVGRPQRALRLVPEAGYALGAHIGVGRVRVAVTDLQGQPLQVDSFEHEIETSPEQVLQRIIEHFAGVVASSEIDARRLIGVGVGASGLVDPATGYNLVAPNLGWHQVPVRDWLHERLGLPVAVDNNVRAMTLGEAYFGGNFHRKVMAFIYGRIGVGAGFWMGDGLYRGSRAGAGEIGHTTVLPHSGERCRCGNAGCLETALSEPVLIRSARELSVEQPHGLLAQLARQSEEFTLEVLFEAARGGDVSALALLHARTEYLGISLANLVNILNPEVIVLGGMFAQAFDLFQPILLRAIRRRSFAGLGDAVAIQKSTFGAQAGVTGAATLALHTFFYDADELPRPEGQPNRFLFT